MFSGGAGYTRLYGKPNGRPMAVFVNEPLRKAETARIVDASRSAIPAHVFWLDKPAETYRISPEN